MNDYINKNEVLNLIMHNDKVCHYADERYENVVYATTQTICKVVADMEASDVQQVVHCKDCKYAQNPNDTMVYCTYFECGTMSQNDFCSQGERR